MMNTPCGLVNNRIAVSRKASEYIWCFSFFVLLTFLPEFEIELPRKKRYNVR